MQTTSLLNTKRTRYTRFYALISRVLQKQGAFHPAKGIKKSSEKTAATLSSPASQSGARFRGKAAKTADYAKLRPSSQSEDVVVAGSEGLTFADTPWTPAASVNCLHFLDMRPGLEGEARHRGQEGGDRPAPESAAKALSVPRDTVRQWLRIPSSSGAIHGRQAGQEAMPPRRSAWQAGRHVGDVAAQEMVRALPRGRRGGPAPEAQGAGRAVSRRDRAPASRSSRSAAEGSRPRWPT